ncbi:MAG TPA: AAA family ATPase [Gaiellaceae bacterium]|nr:AAA family ATPase [Gaiellaceae bacterium]
MSDCASCGFANGPGALYCGSCGTPLGRACPACGAAVASGLAFCTSCGTPLDESDERPIVQERKVVTVLFADLVGFTGRAESLDPEDVRRLLSPYYARVREKLASYGGTVEKFIGDAVVALFGAPLAHEDDPERAVRAAVAARDALAELNATDPTLGLHVRIGVTTGEAVIDLRARPSEGEGMAAGDVVNTCSRLQAAAPVDGILVDEATYRATASVVEYREAEPVRAKGKSEPIPVWEVVALRTRLGVDIAFRGGAELVGRAEELRLLRDTLARAERERAPHLVTLVGEPGIGKSRLLFELYAAVDADPEIFAYWRQGRSLPYGEGVSFWALGEMVKAQAGILESDAADAAARKLAAAVAAVLPDAVEAAWVGEHLEPLVGLGGVPEAGADRRREAFAAWRRFFEGLAEQRPLVLVFEDLQWADEGLLDFVDHLVDWASDVPLLVLCTARPELLERRPGWGGGKRSALTVSLSPLSEEDTSELLRSLLAERTVPAEHAAGLVAHAGGNPLYAEEYARLVAEGGGRRGLPLPDTVQGIIAARLDTLPAEEKALLQDAAVIGKVFWAGALAAVAEGRGADVDDGLLRLERREFVRRERRSSVAGETAFVFRHVIVRDVAYAQIPRTGRAERHRLAAEWLESLAGDRAEDIADMLAHHYLRALEYARAAGQEAGDLPERARRALQEAGDRALALSAYRAAVRFYREALSSWPEGDPERPRLLLRYGQALFRAEERGAEALAEAAEELLDAGEVELAAEAEVLLGDLMLITRGRRNDALRHFEHAVALLADRPPSRSKSHALASRAHFHLATDEAEEAVACARAAVQLAEELSLEDLRAHSLSTLGFARVMTGDLDGLADLRESVELAARASSPQAARGYNNLASVTADLGDLVQAFELYEKSRQAAARFGDELALRWLEVERMYEHYWRGDWDGALAVGDAVLAAVGVAPGGVQDVDVTLIRAKISLAREGPDRAGEQVERALERARAMQVPQNLLPALALKAHALAAAGRLGESEACANELLVVWLDEGRGVSLASFWLADLAFALAGLERDGDLLHAGGRTRTRTRWLDAAEAASEGDWVRAAGVFARIGSRPDEALARLRAAEALRTAGRRAEADEELARSTAFLESVGAAAWSRAAEALAGEPA